MKIGNCPICRAHLTLEALLHNEASKNLLECVMPQPDYLRLPLVSYLGLFRSKTRDLSNDRALKLAKEVLVLCDEKHILAAALDETVQAMRTKQEDGSFKQLTNHNYLKKVIQAVAERPIAIAAPATMPALTGPQTQVKQSKTGQSIELLKSYPTPEGIDEWFTRAVCGSLAELMIMGLEGVPPSDTMHLVIERFINSMWPKREWKKEHHYTGAKRLRTAIIKTAEANQRWPIVKDILADIPNIK
jgi:hypothetical protein